MPIAEHEPAAREPRTSGADGLMAAARREFDGATLRALAASLAAAIIAVLVLAQTPDATERLAAAFIAFGAVGVGLEERWWPLALAALVAAWFVAVLTALYLPRAFNPGPSVTASVGGAAYFDTPYQGFQVAAVLSVVVPVVAGLAVAVPRLRRLRGVEGEQPAAEGGRTTETWRRPRALWMWIGASVIAFTIVPDVRSYLNAAGHQLGYIWDVSNVTTWQLLVQLGLHPMKDFFYPYGFQWLYTWGSIGPMIQWLAQVATLAIAGWSLWRLTGGRTWRTLACLVMMVLVGSWGHESWRYLPAFDLGIAYAALGPARHTRLTRAHAVLFGAGLLAAFVGPDVLGVGAFGAVLVLAGELMGRRRGWRSGPLCVSVLLDAVPVIAAALVLLGLWAVIGTVSENIRFLGDVSAVSAASALNEKLYGPLGLVVVHPNSYSLYLAIPALLATAGVLWTLLRTRLQPQIGAILLAASGVSLLMLVKSDVRPVGDEVLIAPLVALSWATILAWRRDSLVRAVAAGAAIGAIVIFLDHTFAVDGRSVVSYVGDAAASPVHAARSLFVAFDPAARRRADAARFEPERFAGWPDLAVTGDYLQTVHGVPLPSFAVVGDSQLTYALLRQKPPYQVELYDASPIAEQKAMVSALRRQDPAYVIWRKDYNQDDFPYAVRNPLVFQWMIQNYIPVKQGATIDILRRRRPGEPIPHAFWRAQLGGTVDLAYIPSFSDAASSPICSGGSDCVSYALVHGHPRAGNPGIGLVVSGNHDAFGVNLRMRSGVEDYPVRLDRLWFWPLVGPHVTVKSLTAGFSATVTGRRSGQNLY
jgi:hypothetical protein